MTDKKIQPKNPETKADAAGDKTEAGRKSMGFKWGRKLARKVNGFRHP